MHYQELLNEFIIQPIINRKKQKEVVEFEIYDGFDDTDPHETVINLTSLYVNILNEDPNWHFFNEGDFMVVRCSISFVHKVEKFLKDGNFTNYKGPKEWEESAYITKTFQYKFFIKMFHLISEGTMMLVLDKDHRKDYYDYCVKSIVERMIHAWFNHNMMPAMVFGKRLSRPIDCQTWESCIIGELGLDRARFAGRYEFLRGLELERKESKEV